MDAYNLEHEDRLVNALVDPFDDVEFDPFMQTGGDWYRLMLSATHGGAIIHGQTMSPVCETLAKVDEAFADRHAVARIKMDISGKNVVQPAQEWQLQNLKGRSYHGTRTVNKARMLFDTAEWEPSTRVRAANAAFVGGLLAAQGSTVSDAAMIASAVAGELVPTEAITNTELPLSILRHEAASAAKTNHVVYSYGNTQQAITWDAHQFHEQTLPVDAAMDWSRLTTIARYLGEANSMVDQRFTAYASELGVPYSIVKYSWASVHAADYILDPRHFQNIPLTNSTRLPTPALADAYDKQASNMYDAIHRMANEVKTGLTDLTIESLLKIAETFRKKRSGRNIARGTEQLGELSMHAYTAEKASNAVATSARSWDALVCAVTELVGGNRQLKQAAAQAVASYKQRVEYTIHLEPLYLELCNTPVWLRAFDYLKSALGNHYKAHERMSKLKRTTLANSAPLDTPALLTGRQRSALEQPALRLATLALTGQMPLTRLSVDARRVVAHQNLDRHAALFASVNAHLHTTKKEWVERYSKMAEVYALAKVGGDTQLTILYGAAAKAFAMVNSYLLTRPSDGFIDPQELSTSYLVAVANGYVRKRHITKPNFQVLIGLNACNQAQELDRLLNPPLSFLEIYEFCNRRLAEFYSDIANGIKPRLVEEDDHNPEDMDIPPPVQEEISEADVMALFANMDTPSNTFYQAVLASYQSESQADAHARANDYPDFLAAFEELGDKARFDTETDYTSAGIQQQMKLAAAEEIAGDQPVI